MDSDGNVFETYTERISASEKFKISLEAMRIQVGELTKDSVWSFFEPLINGKSSKQVFEEFRDWVKPHSDLPVVAWNAAFDKAFFTQWRFQNKVRTLGTSVLSQHWICAMETAMNCPVHAGKSFGLDNIALAYGMTRSEAHNALEDAVLAGMVYNRLIKDPALQAHVVKFAKELEEQIKREQETEI